VTGAKEEKSKAASGSSTKNKDEEIPADPISTGAGTNNDVKLEKPAKPYCEEKTVENGFDTNSLDKYKLCRIQQDRECGSPDTNFSSPTRANLAECADAIFNGGGKYMVFGKGSKANLCFRENPVLLKDGDASPLDVQDCYLNQDAASCCPNLWQQDEFDFWIIVPADEQDKVKAAESSALRSVSGLGFLGSVMGLLQLIA
jgi:hypothetical protein